MAKQSLGLALLFFFFFFAFSEARTAFDFPKFAIFDTRNARSGSESDPAIFLPSKNHRSDPPAAVAEFNSDANAAAYGRSVDSEVHAPTESGSDTVASVPLTLLNFHPINRRFPHPYTRRFPARVRHACHHHHHQYKPTNTRFSVYPYGDDAIMSGDGSSQEFPMIPMRYGHRIPVFPHNHHHHHHHHYHHHLEDPLDKEEILENQPSHRERVERAEKGREEIAESGFVSLVRKYLKPVLN